MGIGSQKVRRPTSVTSLSGERCRSLTIAQFQRQRVSGRAVLGGDRTLRLLLERGGTELTMLRSSVSLTVERATDQ